MPALTVLINPHVAGANTFPEGEFFSCTAPNMGIAYLAAAIEQSGRDVRIVDANAHHFTSEQLAAELKRISPTVVGVTATTTTLLDGFEAVRTAREALPDAFISMGGIHVSRFPVETLAECPELDAVNIGEGELTIVEMLDVIDAGSRDFSRVAGMAYRTDDGTVVTEPRAFIQDLDALPLPARHLLPMELYASGGHPHRTASIVSSRGCPFGCKFCAAPFIAGNRYRARSAQSLLEEVDEIVNVYKMDKFEFVDDLFTLDKNRVFEFCRGIKERGYELTWTCSARADTVSLELLRAMAGAGCRIVNYGVESGSQRVLDAIGKRETLQQMRDAIRMTHEASMRAWGFFIIGFPDETREEVLCTIDFASELELDYAEFFICSAFPGSPLYEYAAQQALIRKQSWADISYGRANIQNEHMTSWELELLMVEGYRRFYSSPRIRERLALFGQSGMADEIARQTSEEFMREMKVKARTGALLKGLAPERGGLLPMLQHVQAELGYLPDASLDVIASLLDMRSVEVRGTASFYNQFRFNEPGRHSAKVCVGTACHVRGGGLVLDEWEKQLGIEAGQTTADGEWDLQTVDCVGCCGIAPVCVIDGETHGCMKGVDVKKAIEGVEAAEMTEAVS